MDTQDDTRSSDAGAEPPKSRDDRIVITARGELHILCSPVQIVIGSGNGYVQSLGRMHLVADNILDSVPAGCHLAKPAGAREE